MPEENMNQEFRLKNLKKLLENYTKKLFNWRNKSKWINE